MTIYPITHHGRKRWRVDWRVAGKRHQLTFATRQEAQSEVARLRGLTDDGAGLLTSMPPAERAEVLSVIAQAHDAGVRLGDVWRHWRQTACRDDVPTLGEALETLLAAKQAAGRAPDYMDALRRILGSFVRGQSARLVSTITAEDVEQFMGGIALASRPTYRTRFSTLFRFCVRRGWMATNPCERLEPVRLVAKPPDIMTPAQLSDALAWLRARPRALGWFVLSTLCGLRPEEAEQTEWGAVDLAAGLVRVEAQTSKVRQRRVVYPLPAALAWLGEARRLGAQQPIEHSTRRQIMRRLRMVLGWAVWPKDVTRHSAASYWLASVENADAVAEQLGHDAGTLRRHYRAVVTREQAALWWAVVP